MPTPPKPHIALVTEGISHRTNEELKQRKEAEEALLTGIRMEPWTEVKKDRIAKKQFDRVKELFGIIGKDDALHESTINRYCQLHSECHAFEKRVKSIELDLRRLDLEFKKKTIEFVDYTDKKQKMIGNALSCDRQIQAKRKMLLDIEKESVMTVAAALRSIPKQVNKDDKKSPMADFMKKKRAD